MKTNMGSTDKVIRLVFAAIIAVLYITKVITGPLAIVLLVVAGVFIITSLVGFCPLYKIVGINTCKKTA